MDKPGGIVRGQLIAESKKDFSRTLRRNMTPAEQSLWQQIRNQRLGAKFRRQQIVAGYIADFYCHELGLVIEVDGDTHDEEYDARRDIAFA